MKDKPKGKSPGKARWKPAKKAPTSKSLLITKERLLALTLRVDRLEHFLFNTEVEGKEGS